MFPIRSATKASTALMRATTVKAFNLACSSLASITNINTNNNTFATIFGASSLAKTVSPKTITTIATNSVLSTRSKRYYSTSADASLTNVGEQDDAPPYRFGPKHTWDTVQYRTREKIPVAKFLKNQGKRAQRQSTRPGFNKARVGDKALIKADPKRHLLKAKDEFKGLKTAKTANASQVLMKDLVISPEGLVYPKDDPEFKKLYHAIMAPFESSMEAKRGELLREIIDFKEYWNQRLPEARQDVSEYNWLIRAQGVQKRLDLAEDTLKKMEDWGVKPDEKTYNAIITACAYAGEAEKAISYLEKMKEAGIPATIYHYGSLVNALCRANRLEDAVDLVARLHKEGPKPDQVIHATLIHGCLLAGDVQRAWDIFHNTRAHFDEPDEVTFSIMVHACAMTGHVEKALNLFNEMELMALQPTEVTYNSLLRACAKRNDLYGRMFTIAEQMEVAGYKPDLYTYNTITHACARQGDIARAHQVLKKMRSEGIRPDAYTYNTMLHVYANSMQKHRDRQNQSIAEAEALFRQMDAQGLPVTQITMNTMLAVYARALRKNRAQEFFEVSYKERGMVPDGPAYTTMIRMYCDLRLLDVAKDYLNKMKENGIEPQYHTFRHLANAHMSAGLIDDAKAYITEIHKLRRMLSPRDFRQLRARMAGAHEKLREARRNAKVEAIENAEELIASFDKYL